MKRILAFVLTAALLCPGCCLAAGEPKVSAASAVLLEADSGRVLYEKDAHSRRLIASTTKLMTALVAVERVPNLQTVISVKPEYQAEGSSMYLRPGEELTLEALLYGLLLVSGNDAALAIAGGCAGDVETFVGWMNEKAAELGMVDTHFANPNGLDAEGHYSSAYDLALLGRAVLEQETLAKIAATKSIAIAGRSLTNHNKLLWRCEGCRGLKTGYTEKAGRTLVSCAARDGMTLICVTLKDPDDWDDHASLYDYGFSAYRLCPLAREGTAFRTVKVTGSLLPQVGAELAGDLDYPLREDEEVRWEVSLPQRVEAPVLQGAAAGRQAFFVGDTPIGEVELRYSADIPDDRPGPGLFQRLRARLGGGSRDALAAFLLPWH